MRERVERGSNTDRGPAMLKRGRSVVKPGSTRARRWRRARQHTSLRPAPHAGAARGATGDRDGRRARRSGRLPHRGLGFHLTVVLCRPRRGRAATARLRRRRPLLPVPAGPHDSAEGKPRAPRTKPGDTPTALEERATRGGLTIARGRTRTPNSHLALEAAEFAAEQGAGGVFHRACSRPTSRGWPTSATSTRS